jgi:hypothetical protein
MNHRKYFGFQIIQQGFEHIGGIAKKMIEEVKHTRGIAKEMIEEVKHNVEGIVEEMIKGI